MSDRPAHIVVLGPTGSGKTTVGAALAAAIGARFVDSDEQIVSATGSTGAEYAAAHGVPALHRAERIALVDAMTASAPSVIAAAASTLDDAGMRRLLAEHRCVCLHAPLPVRVARRRDGDHRRPVDPEEQSRLDLRRAPHMATLCSITVDTVALDPAACVAAIRAVLGI